MLAKLLRDEQGATSIEYGVIALFLSITCIFGANAIGGKLSTLWLGPLSNGL